MSDLVRRIEESIEQHGLPAVGNSILVAVSGGIDSMVLLRVLHELSPAHRWKITVAHFNHRLRGKESDADERFVAGTARRLGLAFEAGRGDVREFARERKLSIEMAARTMRHEFLAQTARRLGIGKVALAHHADDQLELFFLRLFRGAATEGLAGMKWLGLSPADREVALLRPLLSEPKSALIAFARARRLKFRHDRTNRSPDMLRNRIRHRLLPQLRREYSPELHRTVLRSMELMRADAEFVITSARSWLRQRRRTWETLPLAVQRAVVHEELLRLGVRPQFDWIEQLRSSEGWVTVAPGIDCRRKDDGALEKRTPNEEAVVVPGEMWFDLERRTAIATFGSRTFRCDFRRGAKLPARPRPHTEYFDAAAVGRRVVLRYWRPGDRFQPIGMQNAVKLQDLFVNAKISRDRRQRLVVAATATGEIFWVEGLRMAERFKVAEGTQEVLEWRWEPIE